MNEILMREDWHRDNGVTDRWVKLEEYVKLQQQLATLTAINEVYREALNNLSHIEFRFITEGYFPAHPGYFNRTETKTNIAQEALTKAAEMKMAMDGREG